MRKSLKIAAVAVVLLLALGAVVFVYAGSQGVFNASGDEQLMSMQNTWAFYGSDNVTMPCHGGRMQRMQENGIQWNPTFLENATLSTVQGSVVSESNGILILYTGSGEVRVLLPKGWSVDNEVVGRATLFNNTFASSGESVTIKVLESDVFSNASFSINVMLGYEAINATGTHAYAVLPFNIQPAS
jgi:hypothetical protein